MLDYRSKTGLFVSRLTDLAKAHGSPGQLGIGWYSELLDIFDGGVAEAGHVDRAAARVAHRLGQRRSGGRVRVLIRDLDARQTSVMHSSKRFLLSFHIK